MMRVNRFVLLFLATCLPCGLSAQAAARPALQQRLEFLVGSFEGESRFFPPGATPQSGRMTFRGEWDLDGAILKANYEQILSRGNPTKGHLIFRARPRDSTYAFEAYANTPMEPHRLTGRWEGRLIFEGGMGGVSFREIWEPRGADTLINAMETKQGEQWVRVSESVLLRKRHPQP